MTVKKKNNRKDRNFGLIAGTVCFALTAWYYLHTHMLNEWVMYAGVLLILVALIIPALIYPLRSGLELIGGWMGVANTYILLTLIYIFLIIPLNLIFKLSGRDSLRLKRNKDVTSYWVESTKEGESSMKNQY